MARIRTLKPEFWSDEKVGPLPPLDRLVFLGLISQADDAGRLIDSPRLLNGLLFPYTDDDCTPSLSSLEDAGVIARGLTPSGQAVIQVVGWSKHQRIEKPNLKSALPAAVDSGNRRRKIPDRLRAAIWERDGGVCQNCGRAVRDKKVDRYDSGSDLGEIGHVVAVVDGGNEDPENLKLLCYSCNRKEAGAAVRRRRSDTSAKDPGKVADESPPRPTTNDLLSNDQRSTPLPPLGGSVEKTPEEDASWRLLRDVMLTKCLLGRDVPRDEDDFGMGLLLAQARWMIDVKGVKLEELVGVVTDLRGIVSRCGYPLGPAERCSLAILVQRERQRGEFTGTEDWSFWEVCRHEWLKGQPGVSVTAPLPRTANASPLRLHIESSFNTQALGGSTA